MVPGIDRMRWKRGDILEQPRKYKVRNKTKTSPIKKKRCFSGQVQITVSLYISGIIWSSFLSQEWKLWKNLCRNFQDYTMAATQKNL